MLHKIKTKVSSLSGDKNKTLENGLKIIDMRWAKVILITFFPFVYFSSLIRTLGSTLFEESNVECKPSIDCHEASFKLILNKKIMFYI